MPKKRIRQTFDGGLVGDVPAWNVPPNMLFDATNFLFEKGQLRSRPPVTQGNSSLGAGTFIDSICPMYPPIAGVNPFMLGSYKTSNTDHDLRLFTLSNLEAESSLLMDFPVAAHETTVTVPANYKGGFYPQCAQLNNKTYVFGPFDNGGNPKLVEIDNLTFATAGVTIPITGGERFRPWPIVEHLSRILIAETGAQTGTFPTIYWCKIGDATVWSGDFTSGSSRLTEASDGITGMGIMQNMVLIARPSGFHAGIPTGNGANPYDWKAITKAGPGCLYPESFVVFGDMCFFCGNSDVYMFDMKSITSIGQGMADQIFQIASWWNMTLRAFVTESDTWRRNPMLHIVPTFSPSRYNNGGSLLTVEQVDMTQIPHFAYDLVEKKWSKHFYDSASTDVAPLEAFRIPWRGGINPSYTSLGSTGCRAAWQRPVLVRRPAGGPSVYMQWDQFKVGLTGCESAMSFRTGEMVVGDDAASDYKLCRVLLVIRCSEDNTQGTLQIDYRQGNLVSQIDFSPFTKSFTIANSGPYQRFWINTILVGNFFQFTLTFPGDQGSEVMVREMVIEFEDEPQEIRTEG